MLKKTIKYTDYNGKERTEDCYFNLTKAEVTQMELSVDGGFAEYLRKITEAENVPALCSVFENIIHKSYGIKSDDGRRFIKNEELVTDFEQSEAYSELFMELVTDADAAANFVKGILPGDLEDYVANKTANN